MVPSRDMTAGLRAAFVVLMIAAGCRGTKEDLASPASSSSSSGASVLRFNEADIVWGDAPPTMPAGAKTAVLEGDPRKSGLFTMRLKLPAGARLPPHTHPADERVTVLSGSVHIGFGDTFDPSKGRAFTAGAFYVTPTPMPHFVWTDEGAVVQVTGLGPWGLSYLDAADAPRPPL
jgi:quercetin dioxygenase-like cupin family protein